MARKSPEINAGSMADIAFLLLIFFLVTTTMDVDTGISRRLPPPVEENVDDVPVKDRNVMKVLVNSQDRLMVNGKPSDISELRNLTKEFMAIYPDDGEHPETTERFIEELNRNVVVSKGIVSLKNDRGTSYEMYIAVQNELAAAFNEMKQEESLNLFGVKYTQLIDEEQIKAVNAIIPVRVSEAEPEDIGGGS